MSQGGALQLHPLTRKASSWSERYFLVTFLNFLASIFEVSDLLEAGNLGRLTCATPTGSCRSNFLVASLLKIRKLKNLARKFKKVT